MWGKVRVTGNLPAPGPSRSLWTGSECCPWTDPQDPPITALPRYGDTEARRGVLLPGLERGGPGWGSLSDQTPTVLRAELSLNGRVQDAPAEASKSASKQSALGPHGPPGCDLGRGPGHRKRRLPPCRVPIAPAALARLERAARGSRGLLGASSSLCGLKPMHCSFCETCLRCSQVFPGMAAKNLPLKAPLGTHDVFA